MHRDIRRAPVLEWSSDEGLASGGKSDLWCEWDEEEAKDMRL